MPKRSVGSAWQRMDQVSLDRPGVTGSLGINAPHPPLPALPVHPGVVACPRLCVHSAPGLRLRTCPVSLQRLPEEAAAVSSWGGPSGSATQALPASGPCLRQRRRHAATACPSPHTHTRSHELALNLRCLPQEADAVSSWGNEYVRNLAAEIGAEFHARQESGESTQPLLSLVSQIVPYHMSHNAGAARPCLAGCPGAAAPAGPCLAALTR